MASFEDKTQPVVVNWCGTDWCRYDWCGVGVDDSNDFDDKDGTNNKFTDIGSVDNSNFDDLGT